MIHYNCACLIKIKNKKIFLVRTHDNKKYYLPGGKIEENETVDEAILRELKEELSLNVTGDEVVFWKTIQGAAYPDTNKKVLLNCFFLKNSTFNYTIKNEINHAKFVSIYDKETMAPAVINVVKALEEDNYV
ncbi:NUDIX domain-containing protein [Staphylococcus capitis]|uniref:NUDIX hydrolase n=1 Tax=Staphylococcus capitis TaxID=29388 RepID=UPI002879C846|nr:NUDIX domain-containing protein [Staphylococcus capitis]MDS3979645.1 NUDIX domain-containing protein [Staphylococcus capitis]